MVFSVFYIISPSITPKTIKTLHIRSLNVIVNTSYFTTVYHISQKLFLESVPLFYKNGNFFVVDSEHSKTNGRVARQINGSNCFVKKNLIKNFICNIFDVKGQSFRVFLVFDKFK